MSRVELSVSWVGLEVVNVANLGQNYGINSPLMNDKDVISIRRIV